MTITFYPSINNSDRIKLTDRYVYIEELIESENFLASLACLKDDRQINRTGRMFFDSGAFSYRSDPFNNPYLDVDYSIASFLRHARLGDLVCSPDLILSNVIVKNSVGKIVQILPDPESRQKINLTLKIAKKFLSIRDKGVEPVGVIHGNVLDRIMMTEKYIKMGYKYLSQGGIAGLAVHKNYIRDLTLPSVKICKNNF